MKTPNIFVCLTFAISVFVLFICSILVMKCCYCMKPYEIADILIQAILAIITLFAVFIAIKELNELQQRQTDTFFADYTKRYQEIITHLPETIHNDSDIDDKEFEKNMPYMRAYIDLCSEQLFLYENGKIKDKNVWENWKDGIKAAFQKNIWKRVLQNVNKNSEYADLKKFVENY